MNPYYIHALSDDYGVLGLGRERADQIVRAGSLARNGMRVSFHSDFMMAPMEPLLLAWCAATRTTRSGREVSPEERLDLADGLKNVRVAGTVFEGEVHMLAQPVASVLAGHAGDAADAGPTPRGRALSGPGSHGQAWRAAGRGRGRGRYRTVAACCGAGGDPCGFLRQLASEARWQAGSDAAP